jgi:hypothetical protein
VEPKIMIDNIILQEDSKIIIEQSVISTEPIKVWEIQMVISRNQKQENNDDI